MKLFYLLLLSISVCSVYAQEKISVNNFNSEMKITSDSLPSLQSLLDEKKSQFESKASEDKKRIYAEGLEAVANSGVLESALNVGDIAPDFELMNASGEMVSLYSYLKKGSVILTWYRGGWCPYCNITLNRLQAELPNFKSAGLELIALTPELPDKSLTTKEKNELEFEVLSDPGNKVAKEYGIVYKLTDDVGDSYQKGFDLHGYNGDESNELPLAVTYIIIPSRQNNILTGKIIFAFIDADYRKRAEPKDIINAFESEKIVSD